MAKFLLNIFKFLKVFNYHSTKNFTKQKSVLTKKKFVFLILFFLNFVKKFHQILRV